MPHAPDGACGLSAVQCKNKNWTSRNFGAHPPIPAPVGTRQTVPESESETTTIRRCIRQNRRVLRIAGLAESELRRKVSSDWVKWIEFKPGRSTGPTKNDRSSRSSDDLSKEEEMWPTRKVAVALGAALRTKEGQATEKRRNAVPAGGLNPARYDSTPLSP